MSSTSLIVAGATLLVRAFCKLLKVSAGTQLSVIELRANHVVAPVIHTAARDQLWYRRTRTGKPLRY